MTTSPTKTPDSIAERISDFVRENLLYMRPDFVLTDDVKLIENRIVDSMGVLELIAFLEEAFAITIRDDEVNELNLGTVAVMSQFVGAKQRGFGGTEPG